MEMEILSEIIIPAPCYSGVVTVFRPGLGLRIDCRASAGDSELTPFQVEALGGASRDCVLSKDSTWVGVSGMQCRLMSSR